MNITSRIAASLAIAGACTASLAQDVAAPAASRPDAVATTPEAARAAQDKAVKRSDVATVVRTGPDATDRARRAADKAEAKMDSVTTSDGTTIAAADTTRNTPRAPRADRN